MSRPRPCGRHPKKRIEFSVAGFDEWMRPRQINWLPSKNPDRARVFRCECVVGQVLMEIECRHVRKPTMPVKIAHGRQWRNLVSTLDNCRPKSEAIFHRHAEASHEGSGVQAETLLARN